MHGLEPHLHAIDRLVRGPVEFDPSSSRRVFHLASIDLFDRFVLPAFRRALVATAPEVGLVVSTHGGQSIERMDRGELDAAIHPVLVGASEDPLPSGGLRRRTLAHDGWRLFHRVGRQPCDDLDALCAADHLLVAPGEGPGLVDHALQALGRRRRVAVRLPGFAGALDMLEGSELVMVAPASLALLAPPSITTGPVPLDLPEHQLTLVWPERLHDDPAHRWFRAQLAAAVQTRMRERPVVSDSRGSTARTAPVTPNRGSCTAANDVAAQHPRPYGAHIHPGAHVSVGILSLGTYLPEPRMTSADLAEATGIPEDIIRDRFGILEKPVPGPDDHPCAMGARAAKKALDAAGVDPLEVDLVLSISEEYKEHPLMVSGIKIQQLVGARNAWAVDVAQRCCTTVAALKMARAMMRDDPSLETVLLAGGYRNGDLIDYRNKAVSFMYSLAAGGGAIVLRRNMDRNLLGEASLVSDGDFADDVHVHAGGTVAPVSAEHLGTRAMELHVTDIDAMKARLGERSHANFMKVIREAAERSGFDAVDYLGLLHMKRSAHRAVLAEMGLTEDDAVYLEHLGHLGQLDPIFCLELGVERGRLNDGDRVVLASAGVSYAWGAIGLTWGRSDHHTA